MEICAIQSPGGHAGGTPLKIEMIYKRLIHMIVWPYVYFGRGFITVPLIQKAKLSSDGRAGGNVLSAEACGQLRVSFGVPW